MADEGVMRIRFSGPQIQGIEPIEQALVRLDVAVSVEPDQKRLAPGLDSLVLAVDFSSLFDGPLDLLKIREVFRLFSLLREKLAQQGDVRCPEGHRFSVAYCFALAELGEDVKVELVDHHAQMSKFFVVSDGRQRSLFVSATGEVSWEVVE